MAALAVVPRPGSACLHLYDIEEHLQALADTAEAVPPEQEQEFLVDFATALSTAADKRDAVAQAIAHFRVQAAFAATEIKRLQERKARFERAAARLEQYVISVMQALGTDAKGKYSKLEGNTVTFSLRACPPSVEITDAVAVPQKYKTAVIKIAAMRWEEILDSLDLEFRAQVEGEVKDPEVVPSKTAIKAALTSDVSVPGAHLATDKYSLLIK